MRATSLKNLSVWAKGILSGPDRLVEGVATDTRKIMAPGQVFIALKGPNHDGHQWIEEACRLGAAALIVERDYKRLKSNVPAIVVEDTTEALISLARSYRQTLDIQSIAITGSNGKTTTKELLGCLLAGLVPVAVAPLSFNNRIGVSLSVLAIDDSHKAAIFELGMNHPGEIAELTGICQPEIGVITNVGKAHLGYLGTLSATAAAKAELLEGLVGGKIAILNRDDEQVWDLRRNFSGRVYSFGRSPASDFRLVDVSSREGSQVLKISTGEIFKTVLPVPGNHNALNFLAALAAGSAAGFEPKVLLAQVEKCRLPRMRFECMDCRGIEIINDAYNANPTSMRASLSAWLKIPTSGRRVVVSGDMLELGEYSQSQHRSWGRELAGSGCDCLVFVGEQSANAAAAAGKSAVHFLAAQQAGEFLAGYLLPGDLLLLKGSRLVELEKIIPLIEKPKQER